MCLCAAVLSPEHALYSVQRATRGVCEGISLNDGGGGGKVRGRVSERVYAAVIIKPCKYSNFFFWKQTHQQKKKKIQSFRMMAGQLRKIFFTPYRRAAVYSLCCVACVFSIIKLACFDVDLDISAHVTTFFFSSLLGCFVCNLSIKRCLKYSKTIKAAGVERLTSPTAFSGIT